MAKNFKELQTDVRLPILSVRSELRTTSGRSSMRCDLRS